MTLARATFSKAGKVQVQLFPHQRFRSDIHISEIPAQLSKFPNQSTRVFGKSGKIKLIPDKNCFRVGHFYRGPEEKTWPRSPSLFFRFLPSGSLETQALSLPPFLRDVEKAEGENVAFFLHCSAFYPVIPSRGPRQTARRSKDGHIYWKWASLEAHFLFSRRDSKSGFVAEGKEFLVSAFS